MSYDFHTGRDALESVESYDRAPEAAHDLPNALKALQPRHRAPRPPQRAAKPSETRVAMSFAKGTQIETPDGPVPVESLMNGDLVTTLDNGAQPIRWIGETRLNRSDFKSNPHLRPVWIKAGALGEGVPTADLVVSQHHKIAVADWRAAYYFGEDTVLVPARALLDGGPVHICQDDCPLTYFHILLTDHQMLRANGQWTESMLPSIEAVRTLDSQHQNELMETFPEIFLTTNKAAACLPVLNAFEFNTLT